VPDENNPNAPAGGPADGDAERNPLRGSAGNEDTTARFGEEFVSKMFPVDGEISPEEQDAIAALPSGSALLIVRRGPNTGARFLLDDDEVMSGRHPESDIFLDDVTVSRKHAIFRRTDSGFVVRDVGSLNGTYVNRELVDEVVLTTGDEVQIGKFRLVFYASQAASAT